MAVLSAIKDDEQRYWFKCQAETPSRDHLLPLSSFKNDAIAGSDCEGP